MYEYFLIAVAGQFVANRYCESAFTTDEEQAHAYTSYESAAQANVMQGEILHRVVTDEELEQMSTLSFSLV